MSTSAETVGQAWVEIIPSARGFLRRLKSEIGPHIGRAGAEGGKDYSDNFADEGGKGIGSKAGGMFAGLLKAGAAAGLAVGAALVAGVVKGMENEKATDRLTASMGANPEVAERAGRVAGRLYAGAWGESIDDVAHAVEAVGTSFRRTLGSDALLERVTRQALDFAAIFETDVPRAAQVAATVVRAGLAKDATEAFDLMTVAAQNVPAALREDVMDAAEEYSQFFNTIGLDGSQAFGILAQGAQDGIYGIDKAGDAIKEFTIRATDMSKLSTSAFDAIGLDAGRMANDLLAGGDTANKAFNKIIDGLLGITDPATRANTSIALFGTPLEDIGVKDIPAFLQSLQKGAKGLGDFKGAIDEAGNELNDNAATNLESFKRQVTTAFVDVVGGKVIPKVNELARSLALEYGPEMKNAQDRAGELARSLADDLAPSLDKVKGLAADAFADLAEDEGLRDFIDSVSSAFDQVIPIVTGVVDIVTGIWNSGIGDNMIRGLVSTVKNIATILEGIVTLVRGVIDVVAGLIQGDWSRVWSGLGNIVKGAWLIIKGIVLQGWNNIRSAFVSFGIIIAGIFTGIWNGLKSAAASAWRGITGTVSAGFQSMVNAVKAVPGKLAGLAADFAAAGQTLISGFLGGLSKAGSFVSDLVGNVWGAIKGFINDQVLGPLDSAISFSVDWPGPGSYSFDAAIPRLAVGGRADQGALVAIGDGREPESVLPDSMLRTLVGDVVAAAGVGGGAGFPDTLRLVIGDEEFDAYVEGIASSMVEAGNDLDNETKRAG